MNVYNVVVCSVCACMCVHLHMVNVRCYDCARSYIKCSSKTTRARSGMDQNKSRRRLFISSSSVRVSFRTAGRGLNLMYHTNCYAPLDDDL